jgi:hypothetical protein
MDRRRFVQAAALGAVPLGLIDELAAQETRERANDLSALTQTLLDFARIRFGRHLNGGEMKFLHRRLQQNLTFASQLKAIPLANSDEPDFVFVAD